MAMSRSAGSVLLTTLSDIFTSPLEISSSPATMRSSVDFPQPDGPTSTMNSPSATSILTSLTAVMPLEYTLETWLISMRAIAGVLYLSLSVRPLMNQRWNTTTRATGGSMASTASAKASL
jgi:hypothetical protein